jgi:hydrogenase maturation protease
MNRKLIIGIGNEGREDDGLGWQFLNELTARGFTGAAMEFRYQLQIEDAELIAHFDEVLFVDADRAHHDIGWHREPLAPERSESFTSHALAPAHVLYLAQMLYHKAPVCQLLGISGESFELRIGLSDFARRNLDNAIEAFLLA